MAFDKPENGPDETLLIVSCFSFILRRVALPSTRRPAELVQQVRELESQGHEVKVKYVMTD